VSGGEDAGVGACGGGGWAGPTVVCVMCVAACVCQRAMVRTRKLRTFPHLPSFPSPLSPTPYSLATAGHGERPSAPMRRARASPICAHVRPSSRSPDSAASSTPAPPYSAAARPHVRPQPQPHLRMRHLGGLGWGCVGMSLGRVWRLGSLCGGEALDRAVLCVPTEMPPELPAPNAPTAAAAAPAQGVRPPRRPGL